jgi:DNA-binding ferritin-like protein
MIALIRPTREYLNQDSRMDAISALHEQLTEGFASFSQIQQVQWYDRGLEPAYLHHLFDQLAEEVSLLVSGLDIEDHELALERAQDNDPNKKKYHRTKSMTALIERYSILIETLRAGAVAAAEAKDWRLTDICSEFAQRFDESLWFMVVYLHENWTDR